MAFVVVLRNENYVLVIQFFIDFVKSLTHLPESDRDDEH